MAFNNQSNKRFQKGYGFRNNNNRNFRAKMNQQRFQPYPKPLSPIEQQQKLNKLNSDTAVQQAIVMDGTDTTVVVAVRRQLLNRLTQAKLDLAANKFNTMTIISTARPHLAGTAAEWLEELANDRVQLEHPDVDQRRSAVPSLTISEFLDRFNQRFLSPNHDIKIKVKLEALTHTGSYDEFRSKFFNLYDSLIDKNDPTLNLYILDLFKRKVRPSFFPELQPVTTVEQLRYFRPSEGLFAADNSLQTVIKKANSPNTSNDNRNFKFNNNKFSRNKQHNNGKFNCLKHGRCGHKTEDCHTIAKLLSQDKTNSKNTTKSESKN